MDCPVKISLQLIMNVRKEKRIKRVRYHNLCYNRLSKGMKVDIHSLKTDMSGNWLLNRLVYKVKKLLMDKYSLRYSSDLDFFGYPKKNYITNAQFWKEMFSNKNVPTVKRWKLGSSQYSQYDIGGFSGRE